MFELRDNFHRAVTISHDGGTMEVFIGPRHEDTFWFHIVFGIGFVVFITWQLSPNVVHSILAHDAWGAIGGLCFVLPFILVGGFLAINGLYQLCATEIITVAPFHGKFQIVTKAFFWRQERTFAFAEIHELRMKNSRWSINPSSLAFNSGKYRYEFAVGASNEERTQILHALQHAMAQAGVTPQS